METMNARFYRGYLTDDRSLTPLSIVLATGVALWLLFYLVSLVGPAAKTQLAVAPPAHGTLAILESRTH
jgi:hypothetical protein